jgi:hypothetical protein
VGASPDSPSIILEDSFRLLHIARILIVERQYHAGLAGLDHIPFASRVIAFQSSIT